MQNSYLYLINKLDAFIKRFYKNRLLKGFIYSLALWLSFYLIVAFAEYFFRFDTLTRTVLFYLFVIVNGAIGYKYLVVPILRLYQIGDRISHQQAAGILGNHFPEVSDKLLNLLQLNSDAGNNDLAMASVIQKSEDLKLVNFSNAIDFKANKKYLKYASIPVLVILILLVSGRKEILSSATHRIINHTESFVPPPPFVLEIVNEELTGRVGSNFDLRVKLIGDTSPEKLFVVFNGQRYQSSKFNTGEFGFSFKNLSRDISFRIESGVVKSEDFLLKVVPSPIISNFQVDLDYPKYTGIKDELLENIGDLSIPAGTIIKWKVATKNVDQLILKATDSVLIADKGGNGFYALEYQSNTPFKYTLSTENQFVKDNLSLEYSVDIIADLYPRINVKSIKDSLDLQNYYFSGLINDDYGFSNLSLKYRKSGDKEFNSKRLDIPTGTTNHPFFYYWDLKTDSLEQGSTYEYYFQVFDNDGVNGCKSARTNLAILKVLSKEDLRDKKSKDDADLKKDLFEAVNEAKVIKDEIAKLHKDLLQKKKMTWQDEERLKKILEQQKKLEQKVQKLADEQKKNNDKRSSLSPVEERLLEKQKRLEQLFNEVLSEENKEMLREMEELMKNLDKESLEKDLEKLQLKNENIEKELDRNLELFKELEFEQKLEEQIQRLDELSEEQDALNKELENSDKKDLDKLKEKQDSLNKKFEKFSEEERKLEDLNDALEKPKKLPNNEEKEQEVKEDMEGASEKMESGDKKDSDKKQKDAKKGMDEMKEEMEGMQGQMAAAKQSEDMEALRQLLDNLVKLSLDQEGVMDDLASTEGSDPRYKAIIRNQYRIQEESVLIQDSLEALSKRVEQIEPVVTRELSLVVDNIGKSIAYLADGKRPEAQSRQQYVMTSANNLALLLDEVLQQMQKQMSEMMKGDQNCQKPGNGKPSPSSMESMSKKLKDQLGKMKGMKGKGEKPGDKPGGGKSGKGGMSKEFARMAAEQEALRQQLQEMSDEMSNGKGNGSNPIDKAIKNLEENQDDLINGRITKETLKRQEDILTRLLEAEKSEREREKDNKRKSNENLIDYELDSPNGKQLELLKKNQKELLNKAPLNLSPYYKNRSKEYFKTLPNE
ncbi:MAG: hypothetical protein ACI8ZO_000056 [Flavobacteriales bacterium]|jgi:hypothetical protein